MNYKVTVRLNDYFEESRYFPHLNADGKTLRGKIVSWKTDSLDLYALQRSLEKCEIKWFRVE